MVAKRKLAETRYFLDGLRGEQGVDAFYFKLSAFLNACHSVMDVMLYDFAEKLGLGLTREDWLDRKGFELVAKSHNNDKALRFSKWRERKIRMLKRRHEIWEARRFQHRGYPTLSQETETVYVSGFGSGDIGDPRFAASIARSGVMSIWGTPSSVGRIGEVVTKTVFKFGEGTSAPTVWEVCRELYDELATTVDEADKRFWSGNS